MQKLVEITGLKYHIVWYRIFRWIEDGFIHSINPKARYEYLPAKDLRMRRHLVIDLTSTKWALDTLFLCMWREEWEKNADNKYRDIFGAKRAKLTLVKSKAA